MNPITFLMIFVDVLNITRNDWGLGKAVKDI